MYKRLIEKKFLESLEESPVVLLNGARQTGKSTFVQKNLKNSHTYFTLDDIEILSLVTKDPVGFLSSQDKPIILDEIQRAPELFISIKRMVDKDRKAGQYVLTGSANVLSLPKLSESLAGRMEIHTLWPLSQLELRNKSDNFIDLAFQKKLPSENQLDSQEIYSVILSGGYPNIIERKDENKRDNWCYSYLQTILQKDIRDLAHIERIIEIPNILRIIAARIGNLLNFSELSRSSSLPQTTLKRYLALLEMLYLVVYLPAWSSNLSKRYVKSPKVYLNDTRLLMFLLGRNKENIIQDKRLFGHILENFVVMELKKQQTWARTPTQMYHYRTQKGEEIDIILESFKGDMLAIEVKASHVFDERSIKNIKELQESMPHKNIIGIIFYMGDRALNVGNDIYLRPISSLWQVS